VGLTPLEEAMLLHNKVPDSRKRKVPDPKHPKPEKSPAAHCPGRSPDEVCKEGGEDRFGVIKPAPLGITVDQAAQLEASTGRPARCFKCSEPKEEASP
jgi:hypothetical protein